MTDHRLPPQNIDAEMSILGSVFTDSECLKTISCLIETEDFYRETHRKIFAAMRHHRSHGLPIDFVGISSTLNERAELEECGGLSYLLNLVDFVPTSANVKYYCNLVREASNRRKIIALCININSQAYENYDLSELMAEAKTNISSLQSGMDSLGGVSISDLSSFEERLAYYKTKVATVTKDRFITEYRLLDDKIRGVCPGEVMTVVAEPGGFKTAFLQNILMRGARRTGHQSLLFSMEMPDEKIFERELQIECGASGRNVEGYFGNNSFHYGIEKFIKTKGSGMTVCSKTRLTLEKMERYIELARQKKGELSVVGIDFIQLMPGPGKIFDRIEHNAYGIKTMAKALNVPIVLVSQINVIGRKEKNGIFFSDAKGGGAIEEAADIGLGFYHDKEGSLVCEGLKNRNGAKGWRLEADIDRESFKFRDFLEYGQVSSRREKIEEELPL